MDSDSKPNLAELKYFSSGSLSEGEYPDAHVLFARVGRSDARRAEALSFPRACGRLERARSFLYRGSLPEAERELAGMVPSADFLLEEARLAGFRGDFEGAIERCSSGLDREPTGLTRLALLQVRAGSWFELREYDRALSGIRKVESLAALYPYSPAAFYAQVLEMKVYAHTGRAALARAELDRLWEHARSSPAFSLDCLHALLRGAVDTRRALQESHAELAVASLLAGQATGDRLFTALSRLDLYHAGFRTPEIQEALLAEEREFERLAKLRREIQSGGGSASAASIRAFSAQEAAYKVPASDHLIFPAWRLAARFSPFSLVDLSDDSASSRLVLAFGGNAPLSREGLYRALYGARKYSPRLHDNVLDQLISRTRKTTGLSVRSRERSLVLDRCWVAR